MIDGSCVPEGKINVWNTHLTKILENVIVKLT